MEATARNADIIDTSLEGSLVIKGQVQESTNAESTRHESAALGKLVARTRKNYEQKVETMSLLISALSVAEPVKNDQLWQYYCQCTMNE